MPSLAEHPASRAWRQLRPGGSPSEIRILKEPRKGIKKSAVYRLAGAAPGDRPVIAKLSLRETAALETVVYEEVLRSLDLPAPPYYGSLDENGRFRWLFMGELPDGRYSPADRLHRRLAGSWLGRLHEGAASLPKLGRLPDRGAAHHLAALEAARGALAGHGDDPTLTPPEAATVTRLAALLDEVRDGWGRLERIVGEPAPTLVHGDLVGKNLRVGRVGGGVGAVAFDWEHAGLGPPALDLARSAPSQRLAADVCLDSYRAARAPGAVRGDEEIERQAAAGTVLRCVAAIRWTGLSLGPPWREGGAARRDFVAKRPKILPRLEACLAALRQSWRGLEARGL